MKTAVLMSSVSSDEQALSYSLGIQEEALTIGLGQYSDKVDYSIKILNIQRESVFESKVNIHEHMGLRLSVQYAPRM